MGQFDLNLSTRPFRAFQLKNFLLIVALVVLTALSIVQGVGFVRYTRFSRLIRGDEQNARVESEALGRRLAEMDSTLSRPEATAKLTEIEFLNGIITRKSFSWTRIFANLEQIMPDGVHLMSIIPEFSETGVVVLHINVSGRGMPDIKQLMDALQASPAFDVVSVSVQQKDPSNTSGDLQVSLTVPYHPEKEGQ